MTLKLLKKHNMSCMLLLGSLIKLIKTREYSGSWEMFVCLHSCQSWQWKSVLHDSGRTLFMNKVTQCLNHVTLRHVCWLCWNEMKWNAVLPGIKSGDSSGFEHGWKQHQQSRSQMAGHFGTFICQNLPCILSVLWGESDGKWVSHQKGWIPWHLMSIHTFRWGQRVGGINAGC